VIEIKYIPYESMYHMKMNIVGEYQNFCIQVPVIFILNKYDMKSDAGVLLTRSQRNGFVNYRRNDTK